MHFKTMNLDKTTVCMSDIKAEVAKSTELQQRLHISIFNMANRQKDA